MSAGPLHVNWDQHPTHSNKSVGTDVSATGKQISRNRYVNRGSTSQSRPTSRLGPMFNWGPMFGWGPTGQLGRGLSGAEGEDYCLFVCFSRAEDWGRVVWLVWRVRVVLALYGYSCVVLVDMAVLACRAA